MPCSLFLLGISDWKMYLSWYCLFTSCLKLFLKKMSSIVLYSTSEMPYIDFQFTKSIGKNSLLGRVHCDISKFSFN